MDGEEKWRGGLGGRSARWMGRRSSRFFFSFVHEDKNEGVGGCGVKDSFVGSRAQ